MSNSFSWYVSHGVRVFVNSFSRLDPDFHVGRRRFPMARRINYLRPFKVDFPIYVVKRPILSGAVANRYEVVILRQESAANDVDGR